MPRLLLIDPSRPERAFEISNTGLVIGRHREAPVQLSGNDVSRRHSRVWLQDGHCFIEDLGSSNGTFVNGNRIRNQTALRPGDEIRVGPHVLRFESAGQPPAEALTILGRTEADTSNAAIFRENPAAKLRSLLELSHLLASVSALDEVFQRVLEFLFGLFPKADNGVVVLSQNGELALRGHRARHPETIQGPSFSRSVIRKAIEEGHGILGEDARTDSRFREAMTLISLGSRSFICAPLALSSGKVLGAIQLDRLGSGQPFSAEDLNLLTAVALQVAAVVENSQLHEQVLVKERMERDLAVARRIQESFLPQNVPTTPESQVQLFARVYPALEVSGDFFDYFLDDAGRLTFAVADVCGKGMPAALFMTMCLTLLRHLGPGTESPAQTLQKLNAALTRDNPGMMYVTMALGKWHPGKGELVLATAGHPAPLVRRHGGTIEQLTEHPGSVLGCGELPRPVVDSSVTLVPGETLILYTDGVTEATGGKSGEEMFGIERFIRALQELAEDEPLENWGGRIHETVMSFSTGRPVADDLTLLMLRRTRT